ncbi:hypothetical protein AKJ16_DCAP18805 [Drosera capensis]
MMLESCNPSSQSDDTIETRGEYTRKRRCSIDDHVVKSRRLVLDHKVLKKVAKRSRDKIGGKKDKTKIKCYKCQKMSHFARECTETKKVSISSSSSVIFSSYVDCRLRSNRACDERLRKLCKL